MALANIPKLIIGGATSPKASSISLAVCCGSGVGGLFYLSLYSFCLFWVYGILHDFRDFVIHIC